MVSDALGELAREEGSEPLLVPLAADSFPAPDPGETVVAVSLGHLGHRTDWALLRAVAEGMPELVLLLIGEWHDAGVAATTRTIQALPRGAPNLVWLGRRSDEEAARLILLADVGIVPFERSEFNDTALPYRILKYARLGRRTVSPDLKGVRTWDRAVTIADGAGGVDRRAARAGRRARHGRTSSCASGRWPRPPTSRTGRCGSGWRRWGSRAGGWARSALSSG